MTLDRALELLVSLLGIWVVLYGIQSWKREHIGKRKIELAEDSLALFYEALDAIKHIRHPASWAGEELELERGGRETDVQFDARKKASVVFYRYNHYQELFGRIHASRYRFMAQFGKDEASPFDNLRNVVNEIVLSARQLSRLWAQEHFSTEAQRRQEHQTRVDRHEAVFWDSLEDDDPINPRLDDIITSIESTCNTVITAK